ATRGPVVLLFGLARGAPESGRLDELRARVGRELEGEVIRLGRLDPVALRALVAWALPAYAAPDADRLARRLENDTAGLPLLAVAMLEAVASGYKLAPDAPAWPSPQRTLVDSLPNDLPPAVVGVVCLRFRQLPAAAQQLLGAAAALGERVDVGQLATAIASIDPRPETFAVVTAAQFLPNADSLLIRVGWAAPEFHGTWSHSLPFCAAVGALATVLFGPWLGLLALASIVLHVVADLP